MKRFLAVFAALFLGVAASASAQTATTATTITEPMTSVSGASQVITVGSATGMAVNGILWIEGSIYRITAVSGTSITVINTYAPATHLTSAVVYVVQAGQQIGLDPTGSCLRSTAGGPPVYSPFTLMFNTSNGHIAACRGNAGSRTWFITTFNTFNPSANPPVTP